MPNLRLKEDLTGRKFNKLSVICRCGSDSSRRSLWKCKCDCGKETVTNRTSLLTGHTKSCGCINLDGTLKAKYRHGMSYNALYKIWSAMKHRCHCSSAQEYMNYGGRGIYVCNEWYNSPELFMSWAINNGYKKGLSIDRIDNNGPYKPNNCRWVSNKIQSGNKRSNVMVRIGNKIRSSPQWATIHGLSPDECRIRVHARGKLCSDGYYIITKSELLRDSNGF